MQKNNHSAILTSLWLENVVVEVILDALLTKSIMLHLIRRCFLFFMLIRVLLNLL